MFSCHGRYVLHKVAGLAWLAIAPGLRDDAWNGAFSTSGLLRELIDISTVILDHKRASRELLKIRTQLAGGVCKVATEYRFLLDFGAPHALMH